MRLDDELCGVRLHRTAAERADELGVIVSISVPHAGALAGAVALALPRTSTRLTMPGIALTKRLP